MKIGKENKGIRQEVQKCKGGKNQRKRESTLKTIWALTDALNIYHYIAAIQCYDYNIAYNKLGKSEKRLYAMYVKTTVWHVCKHLQISKLQK